MTNFYFMLPDKPDTVEDYLRSFSKTQIAALNEIRGFIKQLVPDAEECMNYGIPTLKLNGNLVHYGVFKKHIGFFPGASGVAHFMDKLGDFKTSKGTIQFPYGKPYPFDLIKEIVLYRVEQNLSKVKKR